MAGLTGLQINNTYPGLIKFTDNLGVTGTPKDVTDGNGSGLPMAVASNRINFTDTIDFTNATVLGIGGGGAAGFVAGTGADSMKSADSLTTAGSDASGDFSISLGSGSVSSGTESIAIGKNARATQGATNAGSVAIGSSTEVFNGVEGGVYIGTNGSVQNNNSIVVGASVDITGEDSVYVGLNGGISGNQSFAIGKDLQNNDNFSTIIGNSITNNGQQNLAFGNNIVNNGTFSYALGRGITIGLGNQQNVIIGSNSTNIGAGTNSFVMLGRGNNPIGNCYNSIQMGLVSQLNNSNTAVAIGRGASCINATNSSAIGAFSSVTNAQNAVALGNVAATRSNFTTVEELEIKEVGGGIIMASPNGTLYKLTVTDGGLLTVATA